MSSMFKELKAPTVQLDTFSGNSMDFPFFMANFTQAVEEKISDSKGRLQRLIQFTDDPAKELAKSCIYLPEERCYVQTKKLLTEKFGNPFVVNAEYRKKLGSLPRLKANDVDSFTAFENFLIKFHSSVPALDRKHDCSPELMQILQSKLPLHLQDRWTRKAHQIRKDQKREASLDDFLKRL